MSALTKTLIVLLTIATIFLCGTVVTWVANAENYKEKYSEVRTEKQSIEAKWSQKKEEYNETIEKMQEQKAELDEQIASLKTEFDNVQRELSIVKDEKDALSQKVQNWASVVKDFNKTNESQQKLLSQKIEELSEVQAEFTKAQKELNETSDALMEKMAVIDTLQSEKKRLIEEKEDLKDKLNKFLHPQGKEAVAREPVTQTKDFAKVEEKQTEQIGLTGEITEMKQDMAGISLGEADGVKQGMKFYVIRGDEFICEINVIEVDTNESVGNIDLAVKQPRVGDTVTTNL